MIFEYYQAIKAINGTTPEAYNMAFAMGKSMNSSITPDSLTSDAEYYISEIKKCIINMKLQVEKS